MHKENTRPAKEPCFNFEEEGYFLKVCKQPRPFRCNNEHLEKRKRNKKIVSQNASVNVTSYTMKTSNDEQLV